MNKKMKIQQEIKLKMKITAYLQKKYLQIKKI